MSSATGKRYRAVSVGVIRSEAAMDSRRVGYLVVGDEIVCLETEMTGDVLRVRFDRGWASVFWMGKTLLEPLALEAPHPESDGEEDHHDEPGTPRGKPANDSLAPEELELRKQRLADVPLFKDLDSSYIVRIAQALERREVAPGAIIIEKGHVGEKEMYFVAKGKVDVLMSLDQPPFVKLRLGKFFGESALLDNAVRSAYVRGSSKGAVLLVLDKDGLKDILRTDPDVEQRVGDALKLHFKRRESAERVLEHIESSDDDDDFDWEDDATPRKAAAAAKVAE
jgi:CRP-like cAMP-binding protein